MATLKHTQSRRMYSWWWDSHISPKNSKWLQDNLTDMDLKLKAMIKLIEEDADSFARRAEMYYKKRPELMKLIEEFYRAYRALAERYDHATVVIRQAHKTMTEAFPNQNDDSPNSIPEDDLTTPEKLTLSNPRALFQNDEKEFFKRVKKELNFEEDYESEEILGLKKAIAELEAEKEAGLVKYKESLVKLTKLESEISWAQEDSKKLSEKASKSEMECENLKESIAKLEAIKDENLVKYHECLEKLSQSETQAQLLKDDFAKLMSEKDEALDKYMVSLEKIASLENKLKLSEEDVIKLNEKAEKSEREIEKLKLEFSKVCEEKESLVLHYNESLNTISKLENKILNAYEELEKFKMEINKGESKLKDAEKSNESLENELKDLIMKANFQGEEITEKKKEIEKLWICVQEERLRFIEAETAFQTLRNLHVKTQEELHNLASELQNRVEVLNEVKGQNRELENENVKLNEMNVSSSMLMENMKEEIFKLKEEVEVRIDQRNALQQEIYCLKEELNDLNKTHLLVLDQVNELHDKNSNLKEIFESERKEKIDLLSKLEILSKLIEKNAVLENSLSDLNAELDFAREKINSLEESLKLLLEEKSILLNEKGDLRNLLQGANDNLEKLSERNTFLENSLSVTLNEVESFKEKSKSLEDSCELLANEKDDLSHKLEITQLKIEELEKGINEFQEKYSSLEKDKVLALHKIEELQISLDNEKKERELINREFDLEMDKALHSEIEIFILQKSNRDLNEANTSLFIKYENLLKLYDLSDTLISKLYTENFEQQNEVKSLSYQVNNLRNGISPLLKALNLVSDGENNLSSILRKIEENKQVFEKNEEENQKLSIEKMVFITLLQRLKVEAKDNETELKNEVIKLHNMNEGLVKDVGNLQRNLLVVQQALRDVLSVNLKISEDKQVLEQENHVMCEKMLSNSYLSVIFEGYISEKALEMRNFEEKFEEVEIKKHNLEDKLKIVTESRDKLSYDAELAKKLLSQECVESKIYTEKLLFELERQRNEIEKLEIDGYGLFGQLQISNIYRVLYEEKIHELCEVINSLKDANTVKDNDNKLLKERLIMLEESISNISLFQKIEKGVEVSENIDSDSVFNKIRGIEKTVIEMEMERSKIQSQLDSANLKIEELKINSKKKSKSEISEEDNNALLTKDIMLDRISEISPYEVEKLAIPRNSTDRIQEIDNTKILHRLNSDVQKLMNLHIHVQDLKKKLENTENRRGKGVFNENDSLKEQLEEAETTILKLFALNGKLMKNIENGGDKMSGSARKRDIPGQAQKMSERIGRVQVEVDKIEFILVKIEGEKEIKVKKTVSDGKKRRVLLRDYLYGLRTNQSKRKKRHFCGCFKDSTVGE